MGTATLLTFEEFEHIDQVKVAEYLANGAAQVWVLYSDQRIAWVYGPTAHQARCETQAIRSELLPGIEIPLDEIV